MAPPPEFTGERLIPDANSGDQIYGEHLARYLAVLDWARGCKVLDLACGAGYGASMLSRAGARLVAAVDLSRAALDYAARRYPEGANLTWVQADALALPFAPAQFDLIVSFETIEHLAEPEQAAAEIARVLAPGGVCVISTPNKSFGSGINPFHQRELLLPEFEQILSRHFRHVAVGFQTNWVSSSILSPDDLSRKDGFDPLPLRSYKAGVCAPEECAFFVAVCTHDLQAPPLPAVSVLSADPIRQQAYIARLRDEIALRDRLIEDALAASRKEAAEHAEEIRKILTGQLRPSGFAVRSRRVLDRLLARLQRVTPEWVRRRIRPLYLRFFYYRVFPEKMRRTAAEAAVERHLRPK